MFPDVPSDYRRDYCENPRPGYTILVMGGRVGCALAGSGKVLDVFVSYCDLLVKSVRQKGKVIPC